jgi:lactoylglutathione lyase
VLEAAGFDVCPDARDGVEAVEDAVIGRRRRVSRAAIAELLGLLDSEDWPRELEQDAYNRGLVRRLSSPPRRSARAPTPGAWRPRAPTTVIAMRKPRLVGINHVALEVGDIDEALVFYGQLFNLTLRGRAHGMAFVDMGDQFLALSQGRQQPADEYRHFGLVVDDKAATRRALEAAGAEILPGRGLDFRDPWGNLVQIVQYDEVQFTKTAAVMQSLELDLGKTARARDELLAKGIDPDG